MAKSKAPEARDSGERRRRAQSAGDILGDVGAVAFRRFGFVQSAVVSRWREIVGERYAGVSTPESIRFPVGRKSDGTLNLLVEGAHAPLIQHLAPLIIERVNRFFGYPAVARVAFRQGSPLPQRQAPARSAPAPVPRELGEGLRQIGDPELRACLESLAGALAGSLGPPSVATPKSLDDPEKRSQ